jgi:hypothetical protein
MSADIIDFRSASERRVSAAHVEPAEPFVPRVTGRQRAGRKRNPLRHPYQQMELAITAAGKLHRGEALRRENYVDDLAYLRRGAEAARLLAQEFERLVEEHGGRAQPTATEAAVPTRVDEKATLASQSIDDTSLEALIDRLLKERGL